MVAENTKNTDSGAIEWLKRCIYLLLCIELLLGIAHLLWPEYRWGQGRNSYFNFDRSLTLASWLASAQLVAIAIFSLSTFHRERLRDVNRIAGEGIWLLGGLTALTLSIAELTRFPQRLKLLGFADPNIYQQFVIQSIWFGMLVLFGWFLFGKLSTIPGRQKYAVAWIVAWGLQFVLHIVTGVDALADGNTIFSLLIGMSYLVGCTLLLFAVGTYALYPRHEERTSTTNRKLPDILFLKGWKNRWLWLGVGGMTFTMIFLQILLFRILTIFGDYLTAHSVIAIALLGIALGGLIGALCAKQRPLQAIIGASLLLPVTILLAFGAAVSMTDSILMVSVLLMLPFIASSTVVTIVLARTQSHVVYFVDLVGAGMGAVLVNNALGAFREEGSLFMLIAFSFLIALCFIRAVPLRRLRYTLIALALSGTLGFSFLTHMNAESDRFNIVTTKIQKRYSEAEVLFSRSSFVGRYDVIRRKPDQKSLSTYDNGRIIDNIRRRPMEDYQIDPRIPHTLIDDPVILILGLSGDGISKTSKFLGKKVYGVEINPVVVDLQTNELVEYNSNSYEGIDVTVMDGRSYVEQSNKSYDIITLMNAHSARGRTAGRAPSPEYLNTREAIETYLSHLTDRGVLIVEEPVSHIRREVPVWKLVVTMRQALLDRGVDNPSRHFFIFQWRTKRNNYMQIVMKKHAFTDQDIVNLKQWLDDVDNIKAIQKQVGHRMGPIRTKTTVLHTPDETMETNFARILRGEADVSFLQARNLHPTTDDRPFHFDVDPTNRGVKDAYARTLLMLLILLPLLLSFLRRYRSDTRSALPYVFVVTLTGLGYLLVELMLIQRYTIFLGSPVVTFTTVLGTLLLFSGLGSLWSGRIAQRGLYLSIGATVVFLAIHQWWLPTLYPLAASFDLDVKVATTIIAIAPLAFFMGVPFPYALRTGKQRFTETSAALLFAVNAAASALAVPLSIDLSMAYGFGATFLTAIVLYLVIALLLVALHNRRLQFFANTCCGVIICVLMLFPLFSRGFIAEANEEAAKYRVYALSYGRSSYREDKVIKGGAKEKSIAFEWMFWLVQGKGHTILVDTGFSDSGKAKKWRLSGYIEPHKRLEQLGIKPNEVSDVIVTHAHWDHMGALAYYENATVWIQEKEYQHAKSRLSQHKRHSKGMDWRDFQVLLTLEEQGRLRRVQGEQELVAGINMTLGGAHTPGSQYVTVDTLDGPVIIAADATYLYTNNTWHKPIGTAVDHQANLAAIKAMHRNAASPFFILPGHDPLVMRRFPKISPGIVQITAVEE